MFYEQGIAIWVVADEEITIWGKRLREKKIDEHFKQAMMSLQLIFRRVMS